LHQRLWRGAQYNRGGIWGVEKDQKQESGFTVCKRAGTAFYVNNPVLSRGWFLIKPENIPIPPDPSNAGEGTREKGTDPVSTFFMPFVNGESKKYFAVR
jgi:hypothetical protein